MEAAQKEGLSIFWILVSSAPVEITERRLHFFKRVAQPENNRGMCALHLCSAEFNGRQTGCRFQLIRRLGHFRIRFVQVNRRLTRRLRGEIGDGQSTN